MSLSAAVAEIADGSKVVLGHGAVTPNCVVEELVRQCDRFKQLQIFHLIYLGEAVHLVPGMEQHMRVCSPFLSGAAMRNAVREGRADFIPRHFSQVPMLFAEGGASDSSRCRRTV